MLQTTTSQRSYVDYIFYKVNLQPNISLPQIGRR